jgi:transcriptional regulator with XRE-family HTH domain
MTSTGKKFSEFNEKMKRRPLSVDVLVGSKIRLRRMALKLSQEQLGKNIGLTFQQIQKYENGTNRVSASRLMAIAESLNVPVSYFFDEPKLVSNDIEGSNKNLKLTPELCKLINAFALIESPSQRRKILELVMMMGEKSNP